MTLGYLLHTSRSQNQDHQKNICNIIDPLEEALDARPPDIFIFDIALFHDIGENLIEGHDLAIESLSFEFACYFFVCGVVASEILLFDELQFVEGVHS